MTEQFAADPVGLIRPFCRHTCHVTGIEIEPQLAPIAQCSLAIFSYIKVIEGDDSLVPFQPANVIYINAGVSDPPRTWLDAFQTELAPGSTVRDAFHNGRWSCHDT